MTFKNKIGILFLFVGILQTCPVFAQKKSKEDLEREKKENQIKINEAKKVLAQTRLKKNNTIGRVKSLNHQITSQEKQIAGISEDVNLIETEIKQLEIANKELEIKLNSLKKEYGDMLFLASKSSGKLNQLSFLFSAKSFNDLLMRYKYLEQYTDNRKTQLNQINTISQMLLERRLELREKRAEQQIVIKGKIEETQKLESLKKEQSEIVAELSTQEKQLRNEIAERSKAVKRLNNLISSVVSKEISRTKAVAKTSSSTKTGSEKTSNLKDLPVESSALSQDFAQNKNKLPWPVSSGFISDPFGVKAHPVLKGVKIDNHGVDIQTSPNAIVKCVFEGTVLDISQIPGLNNVIAVNHGEYFTIYANLANVGVNINQKVTAGQYLGNAAQKDGEYEINFQIWKQFDKQNPEIWLKSR